MKIFVDNGELSGYYYLCFHENMKMIFKRLFMKVGLQPFSVKKALASDPVKTTRTVAEMGYRYLEPIVPGVAKELLDVPKDKLLRVLDETGAKLVSVQATSLNLEKATRIMDFYASLGIKYVMAGSGAVNMNPSVYPVVSK
jgi:hypothetical protein